MWEEHPNDAGPAIARHRDILAEAIDGHGGHRPLEQGEGDNVVGAFERATDAVHAAHVGQAALLKERWPDGAPVRVRMALHSGEAVPSAEGTYAGTVLNRCARLRALAHGGQVLLSQATRDLVVDHLGGELGAKDLGAHRLRDLSRPERIWQLVARGLESQFPPPRSLAASPNNLPVELSSFVGRDDAITLCTALLHEGRLLTLTGSGGCGKTRLSLRVASEVSDRFPDGVWWVELAPVGDGTLIPAAVTAALGARVPVGWEPLHAVLDHLAPDRALVVLDNCEHVVADAAEFVERLLGAAPGLKVLATSREPLAVAGEVTWLVPSLAVPPVESVEPDRLDQYDAVRLFVERARQVRPNFAVTNVNAPAVAEICQRLDGIPLAIELAAARTRMLSPEHIAAELDDRFRLLTGGTRGTLARHQTLLASIDWSHELLDADEQVLLRRLGVFAGGFTLDAAEAVAADDTLDRLAVLDLLGQPVAKSLVHAEDDAAAGAERYRLLETVRHYALDRLDQAAETATIRDRHTDWAVALAESLEPATTNAHADALDKVEVEHANLRAALDWADGTGRLEMLVRLIAAVAWFWAYRGHQGEAQRWTAVLPESTEGALAAHTARARANAAFVAWHHIDLATANLLAVAARDEARRGDNRRTEARALQTMALAQVLTDPDASAALATEAIDLAREVVDDWCVANSLETVAAAHLSAVRIRDAADALARARPIVESLDNDVQRAWLAMIEGAVEGLRGRFAAYRVRAQESIRAARRVGSPAVELWCADSLAWAALSSGNLDEAAELAGEVSARTREWGVLGDVFVPGIVAVARLLVAPRDAMRLADALYDTRLRLGAHGAAERVALLSAMASLEAGDTEHAEQVVRRSLTASGDHGLADLPGLHVLLGRARLAHGDRLSAEDHANQALTFQLERGTRAWLADVLELLGRAAIAAESFAEGSRLVAAGDAFRAAIDQRRLPSTEAEISASLAVARASLGAEFEAAWTEGSGLSIDDAVAYARRARGERKRPSFGWDSLTPTEREVARHVVDGLANPAIAERMFIGTGTVKTHLKHIFAKLGFTSRAQLAAEASKREPRNPNAPVANTTTGARLSPAEERQ